MLRQSVVIAAIASSFLLFAVTFVAPVAAQDETGRTPIPLQYFMSDQEATNGSAGAPETAATYQLVNGTSGTAGRADSGCGGGQTQRTLIAEWVSEPVWPYRATVVNLSAVTLTLHPGSGINGQQVPQPVTTGNVDIHLAVGGLTPTGEVHEFGAATATIPGPQGTVPPTAVMPGSVQFTLPAPAGGAHPAGVSIIAQVSVACANVASFSVGGGAVGLAFLYGSADDPDTDGDGVPDADDTDADGDTILNTVEEQVGSDPRDATITPQSDSATCPGYTYQEVFDATGDANSCPVEGGFPILLIILVILGVLLLAGGVAGALLVTNKKIKITVSHDGFQSIEKGRTAEYELTLMATGKKAEEVPVELTLKGVPEDWSASLEPSHMTLLAGETAEAQNAYLRLTPPPGEEYESEAQVVVTATPTDADGKTSAMKPGSSVKTKTIVNIGMTPPEGEGKKKRVKKEKPAAEEPAEASAEEGGKKKGLGGLMKRKKKDETADEATMDDASAAPTEAAAAGATVAAVSAPPATGKPSVAMGKMEHDPADFSAGDAVTTKVTVRNKGDGPVEGLVLSLYVNDERADQKTIALGPGESEEVTFHWTAQPDENRVKLKGSVKGA